jgi:hypothetical protein
VNRYDRGGRLVRNHRFSLLVLVALFLVVNSARATTLGFQQGDGGSYSETYSTQINPTTAVNFGGGATLNVVAVDFEIFAMSFVRFPDIIGNNPGQIPPGSTVSAATFSVTFSNNGTANASVHRVLKAWDEYTLTGSNWTDVAGTDYGVSLGTIAIGSAGTSGSVDVTGLVQAWANGDANWGVMLRPVLASTAQSTFHSDDAAGSANRPKLTVEFTPPLVAVEPSTWGRVKALYR